MAKAFQSAESGTSQHTDPNGYTKGNFLYVCIYNYVKKSNVTWWGGV